MSDEKTKIECRLTSCGTEKANAKVVDDLAVPDPEPSVGEQIIKDATEEGIKDDDRTKTSG